MPESYDAIIIGGGHHGLVCGAYLAKAGLKALVLERHHVIGGAAVTGEFAPGFRGSLTPTASPTSRRRAPAPISRAGSRATSSRRCSPPTPRSAPPRLQAVAIDVHHHESETRPGAARTPFDRGAIRVLETPQIRRFAIRAEISLARGQPHRFGEAGIVYHPQHLVRQVGAARWRDGDARLRAAPRDCHSRYLRAAYRAG